MSVDSNTPVDPRVQIELEKLNCATDKINKFEVELEETKNEFKALLQESLENIKKSSHKLGNAIQTAKPYYDARLYSLQMVKNTQIAAANYDKFKSIHAAAKEMVFLAEQGLGEKSTLDTACQEMLSHATTRVNQSQNDCTEMRNILKISELKLEVANTRVAKLQSQLKSAIRASRPYYETRANYNGLLKEQKSKITATEAKVAEAKMSYNDALKNLEQISEEIHRMRNERRANSIEDDSNSTSSRDLITPSAVFPQNIDSSDEYLDFPPKLSLKSSPIRQKQLDKLECPHLLKDFSYIGQKTQYSDSADITNMSSDDIEQWTEIRLSNSNSTSSGYSQNISIDDKTPTGSEHSSSDDNRDNKIKLKIVKTKSDENILNANDDDGDSKSIDNKKNESLTTWISKSNLKSSSRRQSLDIIIDTSDRVKDVFAQGILKIGRSLERRNSESEVANTESSDFFSFRSDNKDVLTNEQVENLLFDEDCPDTFQKVL